MPREFCNVGHVRPRCRIHLRILTTRMKRTEHACLRLHTVPTVLNRQLVR